MKPLKSNASLSEIQQYVTELERERGFTDQTLTQKCLLLGEEVGELFKAVRKTEKIALDSKSKVTSVSEELADILIYLCAIANRLDIPLETAFRDKEEINNQRSWR